MELKWKEKRTDMERKRNQKRKAVEQQNGELLEEHATSIHVSLIAHETDNA